MSKNTAGDGDRLAAQIALRNQHITKAVAARVIELSDGGLDDFEIQSITGIPLALVRLVLRGATPGASKT